MQTILFYEKPGCQNNTRQKAILEEAGHTVQAINLLEHPWTREELSQYLAGKPAADCFNQAAPIIKSGKLNPGEFTKEEALELMIKEPLLIKRPLIKIGTHCIQGFDTTVLQNLINLTPQQGTKDFTNNIGTPDLNSCPHTDNQTCKIKEH
ncbi:MAG: arsenate reductase family protein [Chlorobiales bacterium]|nr:arsenate reductase family protein [Chlorobiales bacterium]